MPRLGVCGWPVGHSRSPAMHNAALAALGLGDWRYQRLPIPPEAFAETVRALPARGFRGVNVTIPHKEAALALADTATDTARAIGAANTLTFADGAIEADNTDAGGLLDAIAPVRAVRGARALVLGAGGAWRAAVYAARPSARSACARSWVVAPSPPPSGPTWSSSAPQWGLRMTLRRSSGSRWRPIRSEPVSAWSTWSIETTTRPSWRQRAAVGRKWSTDSMS
jgi:hypothetical protein